MRLIDGDRLYEILKNRMKQIPFVEEDRDMFYHQSGYNCAMTGAYIEVEKAPTIEAVPVVHGEWIKIDGDWKNQTTGESVTVHQCSRCGSYFLSDPYNFCPHCGADMRKKV